MRAAPRRRSVAGRQRGAAGGGARDDGGVDLHLHVPGGQQGHDLCAPAQRLREAGHGGETSLLPHDLSCRWLRRLSFGI
jgi:hypothetical protein